MIIRAFRYLLRKPLHDPLGLSLGPRAVTVGANLWNSSQSGSHSCPSGLTTFRRSKRRST